MRHRMKGRRMQRTGAHRQALLKNLAAALVKHEQIQTTLPKAKEMRLNVDNLITQAKKAGLSNRRHVHSRLMDEVQEKKLFETLAERYSDRNGGYTRIIRAGFRASDAAPMAIIELVDRDIEAKGQDSGPDQNAEEELEDA